MLSDRGSKSSFKRKHNSASVYWFIFCGDAVLLDEAGSVPVAAACPVALQPWQTVFELPPLDGVECRGVALDAPFTQETSWHHVGLREAYRLMPFAQYERAGKARELLYWDAQTRFCGVCGAPMKRHTEISKRCTQCGKEVWPQLATAVIVAIERADELLMVRARNFRADYYGLVAGFVETGETLEECVQREVREETGLEITDLRYFASQPWPYPCGLMVGFTARYASGKLHLQRSELRDARWVKADDMPRVPGRMSIARRLIDDWLDRQGRADVKERLNDF